MPESKETQNNLAYIRTHVDNLEQMVRFQISASPDSEAAIRRRFEEREGMAEVYLALADGPMHQDAIAAAVHRSQPTVSRVCQELLRAGLIAPIKRSGVTHYAWTDLESLVRVSKIAREHISSKAKTKKTPKAANSKKRHGVAR
jgi:predicted transcriptional regulator